MTHPLPPLKRGASYNQSITNNKNNPNEKKLEAGLLTEAAQELRLRCEQLEGELREVKNNVTNWHTCWNMPFGKKI